MESITLTAVVGEDRRLVIELPPDAPTGRVNLTIQRAEPAEPASKSAYELPPDPARDALRAKMLAAGILDTTIHVPAGAIPLSPEEVLELGRAPHGGKPSHIMIDEDQGPR